MKKIIAILIAFWTLPVFAGNPAEVLQDKLNGIRTMSATFTQTVKAKQRNLSNSSGSMALSRPGKFRWQTKDPMEQLVVADGKNMWIYDVDLEQVTVKKQTKSLSGTAALFLSGYDDTVSRDFNVTSAQSATTQTFDLHAKSSSASFHRVKIIFRQDQLHGLELYDQLGQVTTVHFTQVKNNPKLEARLFQFKPPKGVDVVRQ